MTAIDASCAVAPAPPDWAAIQEQILCPLCDYNLRGITEPRCPECGHPFQWPNLIDPQRRRHAWIFEHHPRRNIWSFKKTLLHGLRPRYFWNSLNPAQPSSLRRLVLYWFLTNLFVLLFPMAIIISSMVPYAASMQKMRAITQQQLGSIPSASLVARAMGITTPSALAAYLDRNYPLPPSIAFFRKFLGFALESNIAGSVFAGLIPAFAVWPWLTFLALMIFRISMRRARVKPIHVLRCVIYNFDAGAHFALAALPLCILIVPLLLVGRFSQADVILAWSSFLFAILLCADILYRLTTAYRLYLKFDHCFATILSSQIIVALSIPAAIFGCCLLFSLF